MISEGGFGCIFSPYISCKGKRTNNYEYISKIQIKNFSADNEIEIGKKIKGIRNYYYFFVPAIYHCDINVSEFKNTDINKCRFIKRNKKAPFVLLKMLFIDYKRQYISYSDYIIQKINNREILLNLIDSYQHLLSAIGLLISNKICHFDLNENNILFSQVRTTPLLIDFGLSIPMYKKEGINMSDYFYVYVPEYYFWTLEVHYINLLLHVNKEPTYADITNLCKIYVRENIPLQQNFSRDFLQKYEKLCVEVLDNYRSNAFTAKDLLVYWETWDNYALSIMYLRILFYLNLTESGVAYTENSFVSDFTELLLQNIHPDPRRRLTIKKTKEIFSSFFYNTKVNKVENYEIILKNLSDNKNRLQRVVLEDKADFKKLERRYDVKRTKH